MCEEDHPSASSRAGVQSRRSELATLHCPPLQVGNAAAPLGGATHRSSAHRCPRAGPGSTGARTTGRGLAAPRRHPDRRVLREPRSKFLTDILGKHPNPIFLAALVKALWTEEASLPDLTGRAFCSDQASVRRMRAIPRWATAGPTSSAVGRRSRFTFRPTWRAFLMPTRSRSVL
jgi:hypothetical protein